MTKSLSIVCALVTTFIWGTAFIAQDTGMDNIGPLTFNAARFLVGFIAILPFAILFEKKKIISQINVNKKKFFKYLVFMGLFTIFGHIFATSLSSIHKRCKCCFFYCFLCTFSPVIIIFHVLSKSSLEYLALHWSLCVWCVFIE
jgi:hypothetical protein